MREALIVVLLKAGYAPITNLGDYDTWNGDGTCVPPEGSSKRFIRHIAVEEGKLYSK